MYYFTVLCKQKYHDFHKETSEDFKMMRYFTR